MSRIAILYICTGIYQKFWPGFFESYEENFLPNTEKEYFVFTDAKRLPYAENERVTVIPTKKKGWPDDTLFHFDMFLNVRHLWENCEYVVYLNSNFRCVTKVTEEEFLPQGEKRIVVGNHAAPFGWNPDKMDYCRDEKSLAYIPYGTGKYYIMGGLLGGKTQAFLEVIQTLGDNIRDDFKRGVVAVRHDESHLNHYILNRDDYVLLPPSFGYPEGKEFDFSPRMLLLDKANYFDVEVYKAEGIFGKIGVYLGRAKRKPRIRVRLRNLKAKLSRRPREEKND